MSVSTRPAAPPVIETQGLSCTIGGASIVADVDLQVRQGELLGVIGPNGAGKTSLLNLLSGLMAATSGSVHLSGEDITGWPVHRRSLAGVGRSFQTSSVFPALSVLENVRIAAQANLGGGLRLWQLVGPHHESVARAESALDSVGLADGAGRQAGLLSHGEKRKLELAILLATRPSVVLLDEPMAGVSAEDVPELTSLIGRVHQERDVTILMIEHHMDVVLELADRIAVMHHGALLICDTPQAVMADTTVQEAYLGGGL